MIYKSALEQIPRSKASDLYAVYAKFEKQHGTRSSVESTVLGKRRTQYEHELAHAGRNYDVWFDYARLEEGAWRDLKEEGRLLRTWRKQAVALEKCMSEPWLTSHQEERRDTGDDMVGLCVVRGD